MTTIIPDPAGLTEIMQRPDVWRGAGRAIVKTPTLATGFPELNGVLLNGGWPFKSLVEVGQQSLTQQEWILMAPALKQTTGLIVLLNPPFDPFVQGLLVTGIDLEQVRVIRAVEKSDFLASFVEIARTSVCEALLAWEPQRSLSYTELRKCLLAANDGEGLYTLFRPAATQQQSSPASLRLTVNIQSQHLSICIYKQRGTLQSDSVVKIELPEDFSLSLPFHLLDHYDMDGNELRPKPKAPVIPVWAGRRT